jgi:hypothetical protein
VAARAETAPATARYVRGPSAPAFLARPVSELVITGCRSPGPKLSAALPFLVDNVFG